MFNNRIQEQIRKVSHKIMRGTLKTVYVYGDPTEYDCPNCHYDAATSSSSGRHDSSFVTPVVINGRTITPISFVRGRCPVCKGEGTIDFDNRYDIKAYVRWDPPSDSKGNLDFLPIGKEGSSIVMLKIPDTKYFETVRDCIYAEIGGVRCELYRPPTIREVGREKLFVLAFFASSSEGHSTTTR